MIQLFDAKKEYDHLGKETEAEVLSVLRNGWFVLGEKGHAFEQAFSEYTGSKFVCGVGNGYDALLLSLLALGIGPGDEVITCSHSFIATSLPILAVGATPVFVDIDDFYHLDTVQLEKMITKKTKAIIPIHLYGQLCDIEPICTFAKKNGLFVIEDACQAHGARKKGIHAGTFGDIGCFSFYPTKNLGAYGDAGAIVTHSKELYDRICMLHNYGQRKKYVHDSIGYNSRLDEIQAAVLTKKLSYLDWSIEKRQEIAALYIEKLKDCTQISLPKIRSMEEHAFHLFVIATDKRDALQTHLESKGIQTLVHYPIPIHKQKAFEAYNTYSFPKTEKAANEVLSLPMHQYMTDDDVETVSQAIKEFFL